MVEIMQHILVQSLNAKKGRAASNFFEQTSCTVQCSGRTGERYRNISFCPRAAIMVIMASVRLLEIAGRCSSLTFSKCVRIIYLFSCGRSSFQCFGCFQFSKTNFIMFHQINKNIYNTNCFPRLCTT